VSERRPINRLGFALRTRLALLVLGVLLVAVPAAVRAPAVAAVADPVVAAGGDIACGPADLTLPCQQMATSDLLLQISPSLVLPLGDEQYNTGAYTDFLNFYDPSWGREKLISRPVVGNHEYGTPDAKGYFDYFNGVGVASGPAGDRGTGYYSYDLGAWHLVALNSNCAKLVDGCGAGSTEERWLRADLAAHANACTLAYMHHPLWSSNSFATPAVQPLVQALYDAGVELLLVGHSHTYERFAPQDASGALDNVRGIREIITGTGGRDFSGFGAIAANTVVRQNKTFGVLKLTLHDAGYDWQFVPVAGGTFTDSGSAGCFTTAPDTTAPTAPTGLTADASAATRVDLSWTAATDDSGVASYDVLRDGVKVGSSTTTAYADTTVQPSTTYSYTVVARDAALNTSPPSNTASATTPAAPATMTFTPSDDAYVRADQPAANTGAATELIADNSPVKRMLLKFSVSGIGGRTVVSATLRLRCVDSSPVGGEFHRVADSNWSQQTLTWNNQPTSDPAVLTSLGAVTAGSSYEVDVTPLVSGDGTVSIEAVSSSADGAHYSSKEGTVAPQLIVTVKNGPSDTAPPAVAITAPVDMATVSGTTTVTASASDDVGVTGVQFQVDGVDVGAEDTSAPFSLAWDTTATANGTHAVTAIASDAAGNETTSSAVTVTIANNPPDTSPPGAPSGLSALAGSGSVSLAWGASSDDVGVVRYDVYRSQTAGFVPSAATRVGQPVGTSYLDSGLAAGTYFYVVQAEDAAGNLSAASNQASATVSAPPPAPSGLVAAYSFDEGSGMSVADASGSGNTGTVAGAGWAAAGKFGGALSFNGSGALVTVADAASLRLSGGMTVEAWVDAAALGASWRCVVFKELPGAMAYGLYATDGAGKPLGQVNIGGEQNVLGASAPPLNTWTHLAVSYDGAALRLYVNGVLAATKPLTGAIAGSTGALRIGGNSVWGEYFSGLIDEVRVYNRALTATQIQTDMTTAIGP
jgi:hypothetical protein